MDDRSSKPKQADPTSRPTPQPDQEWVTILVWIVLLYLLAALCAPLVKGLIMHSGS